MMRANSFTKLFFLLLLWGAVGCSPKPVSQRQLLIYCGITMARPMNEIAAIIEDQEDIEVIIIQGGSGNLLRSIEINGVGDLYLPGSESYIESVREKILIVEAELVGYNRAVLMVQKGNPLHLDADLQNLASPAYYVVIGNPESGSLFKEFAPQSFEMRLTCLNPAT